MDEVHVSAVSSSSPMNAVIAAMRAQMKAQMMRTVLADSGLLDPHLDEGLRAIESQAESVREAGLEAQRLSHIGTLIDALA